MVQRKLWSKKRKRTGKGEFSCVWAKVCTHKQVQKCQMHELGAFQLVPSLCPWRWKSEVTGAIKGDQTKISTKQLPEIGFPNKGIE